MIKFFRKIRYDLVSKGKTSKYLKYAIGEILLVVIGILIALQINNWNEKRKVSNTIESLFSVFKNELENNIQESNALIGRGYIRDSLSTRYINNKITREDLLKFSFGGYLGFGTQTTNYVDDNLDALIAMEKELPKKYVALLPELRALKSRIESQRNWEKASIDISMTRKKELADLLPTYYLTDSISIEKNINYYLSDSILKSKTLHYKDYDLDENTWYATLVRSSAVSLLWKLNTLRGEVDTTIDGLLKKNGLKPFQKLNCGVFPVETKEKTNFRANFVLYNNSDEIVFYNLIDTEGKVLNRRKLSLPPKSFELNAYSLSENTLVQVLKNDMCQNIYRRLKQDYLIIN